MREGSSWRQETYMTRAFLRGLIEDLHYIFRLQCFIVLSKRKVKMAPIYG
jgi:hypothetical protein